MRYWLLLIAALVGATFLLPSLDLPDYRYRMSIHVDTPESQKVFSSVRQIRVDRVLSIVDSAGSREKVRLEGEAVALDLAGRTVYALLSKPDNWDYAAYIPAVAFAPYLTSYAGPKRLQKMVKIEGAKDLPRTTPNHDPYRGPREIDRWPMFVAFSDPTNPATVHEVSPDEIGVKRITIEITRDEITDMVDARLPNAFWQKWVEQRRAEIRKPGGAMSNPYFSTLQGRLSRGHFESRKVD